MWYETPVDIDEDKTNYNLNTLTLYKMTLDFIVYLDRKYVSLHHTPLLSH